MAGAAARVNPRLVPPLTRALRPILAATLYLALAAAITVASAWAIHRVHEQRLAGAVIMLELTGSPAAGIFTEEEWEALRPTPAALDRPIRSGGPRLWGWQGRASYARVYQDHANGRTDTTDLLAGYSGGWPMLAMLHADHAMLLRIGSQAPPLASAPPASYLYGLTLYHGAAPIRVLARKYRGLAPNTPCPECGRGAPA